MNGNDPEQVPLSAAGAARRETILNDALRAADRCRRTRAVRNLAGAACAVALASGLFVFVTRSPQTHVTSVPAPGANDLRSTQPTSHPAPGTPSNDSEKPRVLVQVIPADHVERHWQVINDEQLIAALAAAGKPGGVARLNGKAVVVPLQ